MKTIQSKPLVSRLATLAAVLAAGGALVLPETASANTAANATVRNIVSVSYADNAGTAQTPATSLVDVTVELVGAIPTLARVTTDQTIDPNATADYVIQLTNNGNGPDTFNLTAALVGTDNTPTTSHSPLSGSVSAGATLATTAWAVAATSGSIDVPNDGTNDSIVNGLADGDTVIISGVVCTVDSGVAAISDPVTPPSGAVPFASLPVTCASAVQPAVGDLIKERVTFTVRVDPGTYTGPGDKTVGTSATATSADDNTKFATDSTIVTTVRGVELDVNKYVRCLGAASVCTNPVAGGTDFGIVAGPMYYTGGVSAAPGATLEYMIQVQNIGNSTATNVIISDPIPAFTTFDSTDFALLDSAGVSIPATCTSAQDTDPCLENGTGTVSVFAGGTSATDGNDTTGVGGSITAGTTVFARFRVTIN